MLVALRVRSMRRGRYGAAWLGLICTFVPFGEGQSWTCQSAGNPHMATNDALGIMFANEWGANDRPGGKEE